MRECELFGVEEEAAQVCYSFFNFDICDRVVAAFVVGGVADYWVVY